MKIRLLLVLGLTLVPALALDQEPSTLKGQREKASYALGLNLGNQLRNQSVDVDPDLFRQGMVDALTGGKKLLTDEEARAAIAELQAEVTKRQQEQNALAGEKNRKEGEEFLAANKAREGVVSLESGLQYKILKAGEGAKPVLEDTVVCHYRGTLLDGTEFDSSYKRNQPATFPVKGVIRGWVEALQLMPVGSRWQLFIPSALGYGERGAGPNIGPNATLIFEVELISIGKPQK